MKMHSLQFLTPPRLTHCTVVTEKKLRPTNDPKFAECRARYTIAFLSDDTHAIGERVRIHGMAYDVVSVLSDGSYLAEGMHIELVPTNKKRNREP